MVGMGKAILAQSRSEIEPREAKRAIAKLLPLHEKKKPPESGDWLDRFHDEKGQSFSQYLKRRNKVGSVYPKLYLQQVGEFDDATANQIGDIADALARFFGLPTEELKPISLEELKPADFRTRSDSSRQLLTLPLLELLKSSRPSDAAAVLGLTAEDLYPGEGWNFVFGQASLDQRVGVWSTARFGSADSEGSELQLFRRRLIKLAWHETGHMFGIPHCIAYECGMNGCNSLEESERQLMEYCPECQAKIWWTNNYSPLKRAETLLELAEQEKWEAETKYWQQAIDKLKS